MKVVIVGAGIAGLAIGWRLAQSGMSVEIVERDLAGRGATWASAGMLAPVAEFGTDTGPLARFAHAARAAWPDFAAELQSSGGHDVGFRADGSLTVARTDARAQVLRVQAAQLRAVGTDAVWLSPSALLAREALLSSALLGGMYVPLDAQVDNRALGDGLVSCLARLKVKLREHCAVHSLFIEKNRVRGVVTARGLIEADCVVMTSGAWMNRLQDGQGEILPAITPVKGQMTALAVPPNVQLPRALIWDDDVYLVPRHDRLFLGATVEDAGFDTSVTSRARERLIAAARVLIPNLAAWRLSELWAGLRPRTSDDMPVLGACAPPGLYIAGGQFRNGILFAPLVADILRRAVLGELSDAAAAAFDPGRFAV